MNYQLSNEYVKCLEKLGTDKKNIIMKANLMSPNQVFDEFINVN